MVGGGRAAAGRGGGGGVAAGGPGGELRVVMNTSVTKTKLAAAKMSPQGVLLRRVLGSSTSEAAADRWAGATRGSRRGRGAGGETTGGGGGGCPYCF